MYFGKSTLEHVLNSQPTEMLWYSRPRSSCRRCGTATSQSASWFTKQHEVVLAPHFGTWQKVCPGRLKVYNLAAFSVFWILFTNKNSWNMLKPWSRKHPTDLCLIVHAERAGICIHIAGGAQVIASSWTNCCCQSCDTCVCHSLKHNVKLGFTYVEGKSVNLKRIMLPSSWNLSMHKPLVWICS